MYDFQKEQTRQRRLMEQRIDACGEQDREALARDAARLAYELFREFRFDCFAGTCGCIVYANMGCENQSARDRFRRGLDETGVVELATGVWPPSGSDDAHYTWAVFLNDADGDRWVDEAVNAWSAENR